MEEETLIKFIRHELTEKECLEVINWIESTEENLETFVRLKNAWALSELGHGKETEPGADDFEKLKKMLVPPGRKMIYRIMKYAAAMIVFFASGYMLNQAIQSADASAGFNEFIIPNGQSSNIVLTDGTRVYLNSGSSIRVNTLFAVRNREVILSGEAYFEIAEDKKHPFIVKTSSLDVVATGTSFNVQAYENSEQVNVTLVEGKVALRNTEGNVLASLKPGENILVNNQDKTAAIQTVDVNKYTSWREGIVTFKNEKLIDISRLLERWYNVRIVFEEEHLKDLLYSGTILRYKPVDQVLEVFSITSGIRYNIQSIPNEPNCITLKALSL